HRITCLPMAVCPEHHCAMQKKQPRLVRKAEAVGNALIERDSLMSRLSQSYDSRWWRLQIVHRKGERYEGWDFSQPIAWAFSCAAFHARAQNFTLSGSSLRSMPSMA